MHVLGQNSPPLCFEERDDVPTQYRQVIAQILVSAAVALGSCVVGPALASADQNSIGTAPNLFGGLSCNCRETNPPGSPALRDEIEQGLRAGRGD
jgi:hypothetical protein